jgi:hypothetical protein
MTDEPQDFEAFQAAQDDGQEWEVSFEGGPTRTTSLSWIAYKAMEDPEAEVSKV